MLPKVDASLSATREQVDAFGLPANVPSPGPFTLYDASVSVSYVLDVFGGNRRALEALRARSTTAYTLDAARLTLAGNVVATAILRASLARQVALTRQLIDAQARQLRIVEARFSAGGVSQADVHAQRALFAQTQASLPLEARLAQAGHRLAILLGVAPSDAALPDLSSMRSRCRARCPSRCHRRSHANAPTSARPKPCCGERERRRGHREPVSALVDFGGNRLGAHAHRGSRERQCVECRRRADATALHGGELRAKKRAAEAAYEEAFASYRETVLEALQQVADAMRAVEHDAAALQARDTPRRKRRPATGLPAPLRGGRDQHVRPARRAAAGAADGARPDARAGRPARRYGGAVSGAGGELDRWRAE